MNARTPAVQRGEVLRDVVDANEDRPAGMVARIAALECTEPVHRECDLDVAGVVDEGEVPLAGGLAVGVGAVGSPCFPGPEGVEGPFAAQTVFLEVVPPCLDAVFVLLVLQDCLQNTGDGTM